MKAESLHRMCLGKSAYRTAFKAQKAIRRRAADGVALRSYWCPVCLNFHITKNGVQQPKPPAPEPIAEVAPPEPEPPRHHLILPQPPGPRPRYTIGGEPKQSTE